MKKGERREEGGERERSEDGPSSHLPSPGSILAITPPPVCPRALLPGSWGPGRLRCAKARHPAARVRIRKADGERQRGRYIFGVAWLANIIPGTLIRIGGTMPLSGPSVTHAPRLWTRRLHRRRKNVALRTKNSHAPGTRGRRLYSHHLTLATTPTTTDERDKTKAPRGPRTYTPLIWLSG